MVVLKQIRECPAQGLVFPQALTILEKPKGELRLLWRRPPSLFPNKNVSSDSSNGGGILVLPLVPGLSAQDTQEQGSRGGSLCPRGKGTHKTSPSLAFLTDFSKQVLLLPGSDSSMCFVLAVEAVLRH